MKLYKANDQGGEKMAQEKKEPSRRDFIKTLAGLGLGAAMAQTLYSSLNPKQRAQLVAWAQSYGKPMTYAELGRLIDAAAWDDVVRAVRYQPASYIIYQAPDGSYQAKNGNTGQIEFSGTDAASVIQQAINALRAPGPEQRDCRGLIAIKGFLDITQSIDLTRARNLRIVGLSNKPMYAPGSDFPSSGFNIKTNNIPFDLTSSVGIQMENLGFIVDSAYAPPCVILLARESAGYSAGSHRFVNCAFEGNASVAMIYNYGSEQNHFENVWIRSKGRALVLTSENIFNVNSAFRTIATTLQSTNENDFVKCVISRPSDLTPTGESIYLHGATEARFFKTYFANSNLYAIKLSNVSARGRVTQLILNECHLELGGLLTTDDAAVIIDHWGIKIKDCLFAGTNVPNGKLIDLKKANHIFYEVYYNNNLVQSSGLVLEFSELRDSYLRHGFRLLEPSLVANVLSQSTVDWDDGALVSIPTIVRSTLRYRKSGAMSLNRGTATISAGSTSVTVNHGLVAAPNKVIVTPQANVGAFWVSNITATSFTINVATAPAANVNFYWEAEV